MARFLTAVEQLKLSLAEAVELMAIRKRREEEIEDEAECGGRAVMAHNRLRPRRSQCYAL